MLKSSQTPFQLVLEDLKSLDDLTSYFQKQECSIMSPTLRGDEDYTTKSSFESFLHQLAKLAFDLQADKGISDVSSTEVTSDVIDSPTVLGEESAIPQATVD